MTHVIVSGLKGGDRNDLPPLLTFAVGLSLKKTLFTDAWLRQISFGKILGIALLMEIDLEPLHLPDVLEADPTQEPGTQRGNVQRYLFSSKRAE